MKQVDHYIETRKYTEEPYNVIFSWLSLQPWSSTVV